MIKSRGLVPDSDHIVRYVPYRRQRREFGTDRLLGVLPIAFIPRDSDSGALSVGWVEFFAKSASENRLKAIDSLKAGFRLGVGATAIFVVGLVQTVRATCRDAGNAVRVVHEPSRSNISHAAIRRIDDWEFVVFDELAVSCFDEFHDAQGRVIPRS